MTAWPRRLTARGVRTMLTRRGFDASSVTLTETVNDFEVRVDGPIELVREVTRLLVWELDAPSGMSVAPYPTHAFLSRR